MDHITLFIFDIFIYHRQKKRKLIEDEIDQYKQKTELTEKKRGRKK